MGAESISPWGAGANFATDLIGIGVDIWKTKKAEEEAEQNRKWQEEMANRKAAGIKAAGGQAMSTYNQIQDMVKQAELERNPYADEQMMNDYLTLMKSYNPQAYDFDKFQYDKTVEDYINPEANKIAEMAGLQTQADLAGQGAAKGSGALANMGYSRWQAAQDLYRDAQNQMLAERGQAYQEYGDYIDRMQKKLDTISQGQLQKISMYGGAIGQEQQAKSDYLADLIGIAQDKGSTQANIGVAAYS